MNATQELVVVVKLENAEFGIAAQHVQEMLLLPDVTTIPTGPAHVRGVIALRGATIPLIDLRRLSGRPSLDEEQQALIDTLVQREADHVNWLVELESSVREQREFRLATDPHRCKFGQWYDTYTTENLLLKALLPGFDEPHRQIHAIAQQVVALTARGEFDQAYAVIERTRNNQLASMKTLFASARRVIEESRRELAVVLTWKGQRVAVSVDSVSSVERVTVKDAADIADMLQAAGGAFVRGIGQTLADERLVLLVDPQPVFGNRAPAASGA